MGGRGASSGTSKMGNRYGSQYHAVRDSSGKPMVYGNVKFVQRNAGARETLMETMTRGRVYAEVGSDGKLKRIVYFDSKNKRTKQIDLSHSHKGLSPHVHHGYLHGETERSKLGASRLTSDERAMVVRVLKLWDNH